MLLPIAERMYVDGLDEFDTGEDNGKRDKIKKVLNVLILVLAALAAAVSLFLEKMGLFMVVIGVALILYEIVGSKKCKINGRTERDFMIFDYMLLSAAVFTIIFGAAVHLSGGETEEGSAILGILFFSAIALAIIIRLIYLSVKAVAISKRKRECTERVSAWHSGYRDHWNLTPDAASVGIFANVKDPMYKYYYDGDAYQIAIMEKIPARFDRSLELELFVDPEQPERFYSKEYFSRNARSIKLIIKLALFLLIVCGSIVGILFYTV